MADLKTVGIADNLIFFDNVGETPGQADQSYAVVSLSFTTPVQDSRLYIEDQKWVNTGQLLHAKESRKQAVKTSACK